MESLAWRSDSPLWDAVNLCGNSFSVEEVFFQPLCQLTYLYSLFEHNWLQHVCSDYCPYADTGRDCMMLPYTRIYNEVNTRMGKLLQRCQWYERAILA